MIIYLHGFASSQNSLKAQQIQNIEDIDVLCFDLDVEPEKALEQISSTIKRYQDEDIMLMGSSLGGFYALLMAKEFNLPAVLINPSIYPYKTLARFVGVKQNNYSKDEIVVYKQRYIEQLASMSFEGVNQERILLMLQTGDKDLDYKLALSALPCAQHFIQEGGNHSFEDFNHHFDLIRSFYGKFFVIKS